MKSKKSIAALILVVLALAAAGFLYWRSTPQYCLVELTTALKQHDGARFQKYCDEKSVATNAINDLLKPDAQEAGGLRSLRRLLGIAVIEASDPQASDTLADAINSYVVQTPGEIAAQRATKQREEEERMRSRHPLKRLVSGLINEVVEAMKPTPLRDVLNEMGLREESYNGLTNFDTDGRLCHVGLIFQPPTGQDKITVMLELERTDHWRVVRISNMAALAPILGASRDAR